MGGDFYVGNRFQDQKLFDKSVQDVLSVADFRILNLETPLTACEKGNRIKKTGPHLQSTPETVLPYLQQLGVEVVTLANNHILDYGSRGIEDTLKALQRASIEFVGAGRDLREAGKALTLEKDGIRIAILNFSENEWSIAEDDKPGANPLELIDNLKQIKEAKRNHDKVLCIIHGGHEYYGLPSPRMRKQYRFYAENGADAILGHHPHCISGFEVYKDVPIAYSLGNFLFTIPSPLDDWYTGFLADLNFERGKPVEIKLIPIRQNRSNFRLELLKGEEKEKIIKRLNSLSAIIAHRSQLEENWQEYINGKTGYIRSLSPINTIGNRVFRAVLRKLWIDKLLISERYLLRLLNLNRCEAHSDVLKQSLKNYLEEKSK